MNIDEVLQCYWYKYGMILTETNQNPGTFQCLEPSKVTWNLSFVYQNKTSDGIIKFNNLSVFEKNGLTR
jgi:hypothetical protein